MFDKKQNKLVLGFGAEHQQAVSRINLQKDIPMHCLLIYTYTLCVKNVSCAKHIDFFVIKDYFGVKHIGDCK